MITSSNINVKTAAGLQSVGGVEPVRPYAVLVALTQSEAATQAVISSALALRDRLRDVLGSSGPEEVGKVGPSHYVPPMAERIESNTSHLVSLNEVLQDVLQRLEI